MKDFLYRSILGIALAGVVFGVLALIVISSSGKVGILTVGVTLTVVALGVAIGQVLPE